jgi:hypothetical protein
MRQGAARKKRVRHARPQVQKIATENTAGDKAGRARGNPFSLSGEPPSENLFILLKGALILSEIIILQPGEVVTIGANAETGAVCSALAEQ